jgi:hypothetical protein
MRTHVYANDQEIAAKAVGSDGVSPQAFPDPCWSPPAPTAGPVVIPYPNTCFAQSITNGTSTVFIAGMEVAIEDVSYFGTSTGNEAATQAFAKGVATGVITGKAYFTQWSFDVIFEGFGVPRHQDLVSHNHGSYPSNTPIFPYRSNRLWSDCGNDKNRIERACAKESDKSETSQSIRKQSMLRRLLRPQPKPDKGGNWHWTDDHCDGLDIMLGTSSKALEYAKKMEEVFKKLPEELDILKAMRSELEDMVINAASWAAGKFLLKAGAKQLVGSVAPGLGNAAMAVTSIYDAIVAVGDVSEIKQVATESIEQLGVLQDKLSELQGMAEEFKNFSTLSPQEQLEKAQKLGAAGQDILATLNECTRARKCMLVPFGPDAANRGREHAGNKGCCKGQTGHHLVTGAMLEGACPGYRRDSPGNQKHKDAPTVCVEGYSHTVGSHKRIHQSMDEQIQKLANTPGALENSTMSMDQAIDAAVRSHQESFPLSRCSEECIREQLENYYEEVCPGTRPKALGTTNGTPVSPTVGNNN